MADSTAPVSLLQSATRRAGLERLQAFLTRVPGYATRRNLDDPSLPAVSQLSPYLRYRLISEEEVTAAVLQMWPYPQAEKFLEQLCWRTYFKGYLETHPGIWEAYSRRLLRYFVDEGNVSSLQLSAAREGKTGIDCFDAWMKQLRSSGYLHNHARMSFASIWIFTLKLPWELGAALFMELLTDADPASNTLSWRWVAGLHTPGKTYRATAHVIHHTSMGRFQPHALAEVAHPLPADGPYPQAAIEPVTPLRDQQFPDMSDCPAGLLLTPEDLSVEHSQLGEMPFCSIAVFHSIDLTEQLFPSSAATAFIDAAIADTAQRLARHWQAERTPVNGTIKPECRKACPENVGCHQSMRIYHGTVDNWVEAVTQWAANETLNSIWLMLPPVSHWRSAIPRLRHALSRRNIALRTVRRNWDSSHWPHSSCGYFSFRSGLRNRIEQWLHFSHS